jgi:MYXO-CTERM domain-containing protein
LSGGDAGPEGSALALPVFAVVLALLWRVYRRRPAATDG